MDNSNAQMDKSVEDSSKKSPFDDLSKDELVKKCKGLLVIAQKAKQTKTELSTEIVVLKEKYDQLEVQKNADKDSLKTMQEFLDSLTEQKLSMTIELDELKKHNAKLKNSVKQKEGEIQAMVSSHEERVSNLRSDVQMALSNVSDLDTEITSLKRQKVRLEEENEELMQQMTDFESRVNLLTDESAEQKRRIVELENVVKNAEPLLKSDSNLASNVPSLESESYRNEVQEIVEEKNKMAREIQALNETLEAKTTGMNDLEKELDDVKLQLQNKIAALIETETSLSQRDEAIVENLKNFEAEKLKREKLNAKLKQYREKIIKCSSNITQLKNSKFVLLKMVSEYSESLQKWQHDLVSASKLLSERLLALEAENIALKEKLERSSDNIDEVDSIKLLGERDDLLSQLQSLKEVNESALLNIQSLESEKLILVNEKKSARELIHKNESDRNELQNLCQELNSQISALNHELNSSNDRLELLSIEKNDVVKDLEATRANNRDVVKELNQEMAALKLSLVSVEEENKLLKEANEMLKNKLEELTSSTSDNNPELVEQNHILQADMSKLETKIAAYKTENASLLIDIKESRQRLMELDAVLEELEEVKSKLANYKSENMELLNEMKEINQVMKERGETISKQDMEITEANRKLKFLEDELKKSNSEQEASVLEIRTLNDKLMEKESRLKMVESQNSSSDNSNATMDALKSERDNLKSLLDERDSIIVSLNEDFNKIKKNQGSICCDARSENMSISTTSKFEETSRLKDLDESFEERYAKLRMLAVKLKKRVGELSVQVKTLEEEKSVLEAEKSSLLAKLEGSGTVSKNIQSIQTEYDKVVDKLEQKDAEIKNSNKQCQEMNNDVGKLNQELMDARECYSKTEKEFEFLKKEKNAIEMALKECHGQIAALKKDCDLLKERDAEIAKLKADAAAKDEKISAETSAHQTTKEALEKAKRDVKKKSVLSLEMEDYERSMKDLTTKMEDNKKKIVQMESTIDTQEATMQSLRTQIKMLEDQLSTEERITKETKELLHHATENLKEKETVINSKLENIVELEKKLEEANSSREDINVQLASALGEKEKVALCLSQEKMELNARLKRCEHRCAELDETLKLKDIELSGVKAEFAGYKVRAQNVLRQNQTKDVSVEENLKEEMTALKAELDSLRPELQSTKEELESVMSDRVRLLSRCSELQSTLQTERELANTQIQRDLQEYNTLKLQMSTLTQCYKKQVSDLEERTSEEIINLRKELEFSRISLERANALTKDQALALEGKQRNSQFSNTAAESTNNGHVLSDLNDNVASVNVALLEREEGEGSESTPSPSPTYMSRNSSNTKQNSFQAVSRGRSGGDNRRREPVPLEQLLEGDIPEENYVEGDVETRLEAALRQIESQEKRLAHMTEIIAEAEKEVARRTQLGEALKEEVRRYERQLERTLHHHNQEYLKNVIIKFLTLSAGDERSRLVPVLHTILTLSPEETHQLTAVAKGLDPNTNRGWGSYIPWHGKS